MSQAGIIDVIGTHPEIPTLFVANVGTAVPIANTIEILGQAVSAHSVPLQTVGSGNTIEIDVQYASGAASSVANNAGVASFNSTQFNVDSNGFVTLSGAAAFESIQVDAFTPPGTNPVVPTALGLVTVTGGQVAAGTTTNVIRTDSLAANTYTIQVQRSQAVASSTIGDNGVSHFNSSFFTVDANGFVSVSGTGLGQTITGNSGPSLSPTLGNWNIGGTGSLTSSGSGSTLTFSMTGLNNHAVLVGAGTATITNVGPTATAGQVLQSSGSSADPAFSTATYPSTTTINQVLYSSSANVVGGITASNNGVLISGTTGIPSWLANSGTPGFVLTANSGAPPSWQSITAEGAITQINGDTGSITPTAGVVTFTGTGSGLTFSGASSTMTLGGTLNVSHGGTLSTSFNTTGVVISGATSTTALTAITLTDGQLAIGSSSGNPAAATLTAGTGISITNGSNTITVAATGAGFTWSDKATNFNAAVENGYFVTGTTTATLPASPSEGNAIEFIVDDTNVLTITANTGQKIRIGSVISAAAGTAANNARGDSLSLVYRATGTTWIANSVIGTWTVT